MASAVQILLTNLTLIGALALNTLGIALTYKTANTANFAQSITATIGAFAAAYFSMRMGLPVWVAAFGGVAVCFLIGFVIDAVIIRRISSGGTGRVMITLGLIILITAFIPIVFGMIPYEFPRFFDENVNFTLFGASLTVTRNSLFAIGVSATVIAGIFIALHATKWGLGMRATASNSAVAAMLGINTNSMTAISWAISSACGSLGAILTAAQSTRVDINMLANVQTFSLLAFIMGGFTSFHGPVIGAVIIAVVLSMVSIISGLWANVMLYAFVLLVILIKPNGLFGKQAIKKV